MRLGYQMRRLQDVVRCLAIKNELIARDQWSRHRLTAFQQQLSSLVRHAIAHSLFYRERYSRLDTGKGVVLHDLPVIARQQ